MPTKTAKRLPVLGNDCCSVIAEPISEKFASELADGFAALSDPVRLRLFNLIASSENGEVCGCELAGPLKKSQPTISHHLKVLFEAGLLNRERRGVWIWYSVDKGRLNELRVALK